jgi:xylose isomerase
MVQIESRAYAEDALVPSRTRHKFSFGLWTVGNSGRDQFGEATRARLDPNDSVRHLAELGAFGVSMHDDDLVPYDASPADRDAIVRTFGRTLEETGLIVSMATTNLFGHPVFKDGAFTSNDRAVRRYAIAKTMRAIDIGAELGAKTYVFWGGREGVEAMASKRPSDALDRYREAIDFLCDYAIDRDYGMRFAIEPKPNEPRGDAFLPTVGHALAFIGSLAHPEMVGVNPETAHETMSGLSFYHAVAQAIWHGKLFHIDLNGQKIGRFDQDLRFGSEGLKDAFFLVKLLEESGYEGPRHFDAHAYRGEDSAGVWDFAAGCMRTYLILKEKAERFARDPEIAAALAEASEPELAQPTVGRYTPEIAADLKTNPGDPNALAGRGYHNERLDQLVMELLMGAR